MENVITPFNMSTNSIWLIQIVLPTLITVIGWISVFSFKSLDTMIRNLGTFNNFIFNTYNILGRLKSGSPLYDIEKKSLLQNYQESRFKMLYKEAGNSFVDFIFVWEQFEIVFKQLIKQRYALNEEFTEISSYETETWSDYNRVLGLFFNADVELVDKDRIAIADSMMKLFLKYLDFTCCLTDLRNNLQNFVFSKTLDEHNEKRKVKDISILTIETLIQKHKNKIDQL